VVLVAKDFALVENNAFALINAILLISAKMGNAPLLLTVLDATTLLITAMTVMPAPPILATLHLDVLMLSSLPVQIKIASLEFVYLLLVANTQESTAKMETHVPTISVEPVTDNAIITLYLAICVILLD